jgi:hypothetical protein
MSAGDSKIVSFPVEKESDEGLNYSLLEGDSSLRGSYS